MKSSEYRAVSEQGPSDFAIDCEHFDHFCSPPAENSNPAGGPKGADGQGVCAPKARGDARRQLQKSNLDKTQRAVVRKGQTVDYMGLRCRVQRVRLGMFWGQTLIKKESINFPTAWVRVVA